MYTTTRPPAEPSPGAPATDGDGRRARLGPNVVLLGLTSMFTDISSEMVTSILPLYLAVMFGFGPAAFGGFDGLYQGAAALSCVVAAVLADRRRRHKEVAAAGYGISALAKLVLATASAGSWVPIVGVLYADRFGKGIRTAPRDALISLSAPRARRAEAFGVHRALDTLGAVLGPVVAAVVLARDPSGFRTVFVVSFLVAVVGLAVLVLLVDGRPGAGAPAGGAPLPADEVTTASWRDAVGLLGHRRFRAVCIAAGVLALATPGDALLYLTFAKGADLSAASFPLLYVGASLVFLAAAVPLGRLSDRVGPARVFVAGELAMAGAFAVLATGNGSLPALLALLALIGGFYAATDGVLMALASGVVPARVRASGLSLVTVVLVVGHLVASVAYGWLWQVLGADVAARAFLVALVAAVVVTSRVLRPFLTGAGTRVEVGA